MWPGGKDHGRSDTSFGYLLAPGNTVLRLRASSVPSECKGPSAWHDVCFTSMSVLQEFLLTSSSLDRGAMTLRVASSALV